MVCAWAIHDVDASRRYIDAQVVSEPGCRSGDDGRCYTDAVKRRARRSSRRRRCSRRSSIPNMVDNVRWFRRVPSSLAQQQPPLPHGVASRAPPSPPPSSRASSRHHHHHRRHHHHPSPARRCVPRAVRRLVLRRVFLDGRPADSHVDERADERTTPTGSSDALTHIVWISSRFSGTCRAVRGLSSLPAPIKP